MLGGSTFANAGIAMAVVPAARELAERRGYDLDGSYAYSDSITDVPMLSTVGHAFTVNADRALRREAAENGWGNLTFSRPVALRPFISRTTSAVAGAAALAAAVVIVWAVSRRRR